MSFRIKHSVLTPDHVSLDRTSVCVKPGLKSTDQRFSEAVVAHDSVIAAKSCSLATDMQPVGIDGQQSMEQTHAGMHTQSLE